MGLVRKTKRQAWYLSKYLCSDDFERYHFSQGWVFKGWIGWSKWYKKNWGVYPPRDLICHVARLSRGEGGVVLELYVAAKCGVG